MGSVPVVIPSSTMCFFIGSATSCATTGLRRRKPPLLQALEILEAFLERGHPLLDRQAWMPEPYEQDHSQIGALVHDLVLEAVVEEDAPALLPGPPRRAHADPGPVWARDAQVAGEPRVRGGAVGPEACARREGREDDLARPDLGHGHRARQELLERAACLRQEPRDVPILVLPRAAGLRAVDHELAPL